MEKEAILHIPLSQFAFAEKEDRLVIRIRCKKGDLKRCVLLWGDRVAMEEPLPVKQSEMEHVASDMLYDYYEVKITSPYTRVCYYFRLEDDTESLYYYGRGFVQLTWFDNYKTFTDLLKVDLLKSPQLACDVDIATKILIYGMLNGTFTGKKLSSYIKYGIDDFEWINARRIINGTDKAELIAGYAKTFLEYLYLDSDCVC